MYPPIKITVAGLGLAATVALGVLVPAAPAGTHLDGNRERGPLDIHRTRMSQHRARMRLAVTTADSFPVRALRADPEMKPEDPEDYLCLELVQRTKKRRFCLIRRDSGRLALVGGAVGGSGQMLDHERLGGARIRHRSRRSLQASFAFKAARLRPGGFHWRVLSGWGDESCAPAPPPPPPPPPREGDPKRRGRVPDQQAAQGRRRPCDDRAPNRGLFKSRVIRPHIVGCTRDEDMFNSSGSRSMKEIALTFDDGPSGYTGRVLDILHNTHVSGTFFLVGENIPGRTWVMRRMIDEGHEIGNHSMHHETNGASSSSVAETSARIREATGFEPCLYRPPGGYVSASTSRAAWQRGMSNILWDVDPTDWQQPGSSAIYSRVVSNARSGSIVLMHDGGGDRSGTVAALDDIIHTLKGRGYRLVTVSRLLNEHFRWVP